MVELRVATRDALAALWLPWCVHRERPDELIRIDLEPGRRDEARQLRVGDVADKRVRAALSTQLRDDGRDSLAAIVRLAAAFARAAVAGPLVVAGAAVFALPEGPMLHEGCHRSCALLEGGIERFELRAALHPIFGDWAIYEERALRASA